MVINMNLIILPIVAIAIFMILMFIILLKNISINIKFSVIYEIFTFVLIVLKLTKLINISWVWVLSPMWICIYILDFIILIYLLNNRNYFSF